MRTRVVAVLLASAFAAAPLTIAGEAVAKAKPHKGQFCSPKKTPPKGFKCVKGKDNRYRLQ